MYAAENDVRANSLGVDGLDYTSIDSARDVLDKVDEATGKVFAARARLMQSAPAGGAMITGQTLPVDGGSLAK